ncbi:hypothetical protein DITRI_Ditri10aG0116600 [Diplodiscus trichospermus]
MDGVCTENQDEEVAAMVYRLDESTGLGDYDMLEKITILFRPKLIITGASAYPCGFNYPQHNLTELMDMANISGLVAAFVFANPFEYCDIVTTTTHKLRVKTLDISSLILAARSPFFYKISRDCQELELSISKQLSSLLYLEPDSEFMFYTSPDSSSFPAAGLLIATLLYPSLLDNLFDCYCFEDLDPAGCPFSFSDLSFCSSQVWDYVAEFLETY